MAETADAETDSWTEFPPLSARSGRVGQQQPGDRLEGCWCGCPFAVDGLQQEQPLGRAQRETGSWGWDSGSNSNSIDSDTGIARISHRCCWFAVLKGEAGRLLAGAGRQLGRWIKQLQHHDIYITRMNPSVRQLPSSSMPGLQLLLTSSRDRDTVHAYISDRHWTDGRWTQSVCPDMVNQSPRPSPFSSFLDHAHAAASLPP